MNGYLPGFEPDAAERAQLRFVGGVLDLRQFDKILVSISGGKDSHAMLWLVRDLADRQGVPRDRLLAVYADTGMEWRNAGEHVEAICKAAGAESKARSTYAEFLSVPRLNSRERQVFGWRPMLAFSEADIWAMVRDTGVPRHVCYEMGCNRLGCAGCIFSKDHELRIEMRENPAIFEALDRLEAESGYTMSMSGKRIRDRIK